MKTRVITGTVFTIVILAAIIVGGWFMLAMLGAAMVISTYEMYKAIRNTGIEPVRWTGYLFCSLIICAESISLLHPTTANLSMIALIISAMAAMIRLVSHGKIAVESLMATVFPMVYPGVFYIGLMNMASIQNRAIYVAAMVLSFFTASINDAFALFGGMLFGKHKLSPILSPKKTIEGSITGIVFSVIFSACIPLITPLFLFWDKAFIASQANLPPIWAFAILGLFCGILSQIGDLTASMVKRHCNVKDFGYLLPGHGGVMDRLDGVLFCSAACYIFFEVFKLI